LAQVLPSPAKAAEATSDDTFIPPPIASGASRGVPGGAPYISPHTATKRTAKYGYKNDSGRAYGNGPMDATSQQIVKFVSGFKAPELTDKVMSDLGLMLVDTIGSGISGFETDSIRAGARLAQLSPGGALKSTVWGYGIQSTPDMAGFVGSCMVRHHDFNNAGMHETDMVPGILAMGEALHASGPQVLSAMILFWEVFAALLTAQPSAPGVPGIRGVWSTIDNLFHAPALAMAAGKMLNLNEDQLGNALSLSFVNSLALGIDHWEGPNSMAKSNHDANLLRAGIFAALGARAGMTGPAQPFEGGKGLWDVITGPFKIRLPPRVGGDPMKPLPASDNRYVAQTVVFKRYPGNGGAAISQTVADVKKFAKLDDIASIAIEVNSFGDGADPGKWDPLNEETADHSLAYCYARLLMDDDLFLDAYTKEKMTDPPVRALMAKMTIQENPAVKYNRLTVRNKTGQEITKESGMYYEEPMTVEDVNKKFERICAYKSVSNTQRDKIRTTWMDLRGVKDIADPIRATLAHFGNPKPL
jgi:2-methylcitrate dehydratase